MPVGYFNLNTTLKLPPLGKEYMCFHIDGKSTQEPKNVKSRIMPKVIDCVLSMDTFEQQYVVLNIILQLPRFKYYMKTIGIDHSLRNSALFEHRCL